MMNDHQAKYFLDGLHDILASTCPFPEGSTVDPRYAATIGYLMGTIIEGLASVRENRPVRLVKLEQERDDARRALRKIADLEGDPEIPDNDAFARHVLTLVRQALK